MSEKSNQDTYQVYCKGYLSEDKTRVLTLLYQPLCRAEAFGLYMTLYHEVERARILNTPSTHYRLLHMCQLDMPTFEGSVACLEGLGLLRSYRKKGGKQADYLYEVLMPLSARRFFGNELLNTLLYRTLGEVDYEKTRYCFICPQIDTNQYENISHRFDEVFHINLNDKDILKTNPAFVGDSQKEPTLQYDLELFYRGLQDYQVPRLAITKEIEKAIVQYGILYHVSPIVMRELVYDVYDCQKIEISDLKERCQRYYEFETHSKPQAVMQQARPSNLQTKNRRDEKIKQLSSLSPYQYLSALQNGTAPTARDLALIENVLTRQKLSTGVVNVLIETVLQLNNGQLPRNHLEYLAGMFARKKITTVEDAMKEAKTYMNQKQASTPVDIEMPETKAVVTAATKVNQEDLSELKKEIQMMLKGG